MIPPILKRTFYSLFRYPMRTNAWVYKKFRSPKEGLKVHLGPGQGNYINGWLNVDANFISAKIDLWANLLIHYHFVMIQLKYFIPIML